MTTKPRAQFYSERVFARASRPIDARLRKDPSGSRTWTTRDIVAEILRDDGHFSHVGSDAQPPVPIYGYAPERLHEYIDALEVLASRQVETYTRRGKTHTRAMKSTTPILLAAVASYPEPSMEDTAERRRWIELVVQASKARFGKRLRSIVGHLDENYFHLHLLADNVGAPVGGLGGLHMGHAAAAAEPVKSLKGEAYRRGCSAVQDWYSEHVAKPMGWARMSPAPRPRVGRAKALRERQAEIEAMEADLRARAQRVALAEADLEARTARVNASWAQVGDAAEKLTVLRYAIQDQSALEGRMEMIKRGQMDEDNPLF
ncbi:MAG: hypothetical protein Q8S12_11620 [Hydrogenophaga sp.]|uniref:hypothetical protein n=1 Tax=Hydrogenophaga sp. TaxID=1904254 RepID=UPI0027351DEF|nr:hypothetical protein [Hydrogenophaga sp.]MDP3627239.1 hypothetical protein [Hydrogenophaga sp.]